MNYDDPINDLEQRKGASAGNASRLFKQIMKRDYTLKALDPGHANDYECDHCFHTNRANYGVRDGKYDVAMADLDTACNQSCMCQGDPYNMESFLARISLSFQLGLREKVFHDVQLVINKLDVEPRIVLECGNDFAHVLYQFNEAYLCV